MDQHAPNSEKAPDSELDLEQLSEVSTSGLKPWMNPEISTEDRLAKYKEFVFQKLEKIGAAYKRADCEMLREMIMNEPETEAYIRESQKLAKMDAEAFKGQLLSRTGFVETVVGCISVNGQQLDTLLAGGLLRNPMLKS